ncbi:HAD-IA family hydrolase [Sphingomonas donggukensis]|uniref:Phosphoglycolate phosphatase n=1 Tax=Sphingomonas donggukensis TaxID=2949093 RepID=A0ABY4TX11_9SPHN|nr:HAD-IA family hydrolase [Sphingomonas donggukensis]URW76940.1 HAD-IA family hydrolase [Sphingomonas donggukensis]
MTAKPFDIVGFDLDGTLVDTSGDLTAAVNVALAAAGRAPLSADEVRPMIGGGAKHMLRLTLDATGGCDEADFRRYYKMLLASYEASISVHSQPFPGAVDALDRLAGLGVTVAVVTNKFESFAVKLLDDLGLSERFACVIGGDTLGPGNAKPSPAPLREMIERCGGGSAAFVGDSIYDMMAARNAGVPAIAVSFGFLTGPVEDLGADAVIDDYGALMPTLDRLSATWSTGAARA